MKLKLPQLNPKEKKSYIISLIIAASIIAGVIVLDMVSKALTYPALYGTDPIQLIPNFLYFTSVKNYFAAFSSSFGMSNEAFLYIMIPVTFVVVAIVLGVIIFNFRKHMLFTVSMSMIAAGAIGNLIDRMAFGFVRDFIMIKYFGLELFGSDTFPIFNVADISLVCGAIVMLVWAIFFFIRTPKKKEEETTQESTQNKEEV